MATTEKTFEVGTKVWYLDNEDPTDTGEVFELAPGSNFYIGVKWADGETDHYHPSQLGIL